MDYYNLSSELNAREILRYLNELGIHNISGEVLKYFITDLKKVIKYDLQKREGRDSEKQSNNELSGPERLHSATTFSSRSKAKIAEETTFKCSCIKDYRVRSGLSARGLTERHSAPTLPQSMVSAKRSCSCIRTEKKSASTQSDSKSSANLIKVPKQVAKKKCDPVSLYHFYTTMWSKYKSNVPGENNWSELRWDVRQKMASCGRSQETKVVENKNIKVKFNNKAVK